MATHHHTTSGASVIAGMLTPPSYQPVMIDTSPDDPDFDLITAWNARQSALAASEARGAFYYIEDHSPAEADALSLAEDAVFKAEAKTLRGVLCKLWVGLAATGDGFTVKRRQQGDAIRRADFWDVESFAEDLDYGAHNLFNAIRDLRRIIAAQIVFIPSDYTRAQGRA